MTSRIVAGMTWALVVAAAIAAAAAHGSDTGGKSGPPEPPPPPPGIAEVYYSTCGGAHIPVKAVVSKVGPGDPGYEELRKYYASDAYRRYLKEVEKYVEENTPKEPAGKDKPYGSDTPEWPSVKPKTDSPTPSPPSNDPKSDTPPVERRDPPVATEPQTPESPAAPAPRRALNPNFRPEIKMPATLMGYDLTKDPWWNGAKLARGPSASYVNRDPKQDLARWLRSSLYHDPADQPEYASHSEKTPVKLTEIDSK